MSSHLVPRPILQLEDIEGLGYGDDPSASRFGEARIMAAKNVRRKNSLTASRDSSMRIGCSPTPSGLEKDCVEASSGYGMPARVQREVHLESPHRQRCNSIISHKPSATADENNNNDVRHDQHHQLHQPHRQIDPCSTKPPTPTAPPLLLRSNGARLDTGALPGLPEDGGGGYRRGDSVMPYGLSSDAPPESYGAVEGEYQRQQQDHFTTSGLRPSKSVSDLTSLQYYEINGAAKIVGGGEGDSEQRNEGDSRSGMGGTIGKQGGFTCRRTSSELQQDLDEASKMVCHLHGCLSGATNRTKQLLEERNVSRGQVADLRDQIRRLSPGIRSTPPNASTSTYATRLIEGASRPSGGIPVNDLGATILDDRINLARDTARNDDAESDHRCPSEKVGDTDTRPCSPLSQGTGCERMVPMIGCERMVPSYITTPPRRGSADTPANPSSDTGKQLVRSGEEKAAHEEISTPQRICETDARRKCDNRDKCGGSSVKRGRGTKTSPWNVRTSKGRRELKQKYAGRKEFVEGTSVDRNAQDSQGYPEEQSASFDEGHRQGDELSHRKRKTNMRLRPYLRERGGRSRSPHDLKEADLTGDDADSDDDDHHGNRKDNHGDGVAHDSEQSSLSLSPYLPQGGRSSGEVRGRGSGARKATQKAMKRLSKRGYRKRRSPETAETARRHGSTSPDGGRDAKSSGDVKALPSTADSGDEENVQRSYRGSTYKNDRRRDQRTHERRDHLHHRLKTEAIISGRRVRQTPQIARTEVTTTCRGHEGASRCADEHGHTAAQMSRTLRGVRLAHGTISSTEESEAKRLGKKRYTCPTEAEGVLVTLARLSAEARRLYGGRPGPNGNDSFNDAPRRHRQTVEGSLRGEALGSKRQEWQDAPGKSSETQDALVASPPGLLDRPVARRRRRHSATPLEDSPFRHMGERAMAPCERCLHLSESVEDLQERARLLRCIVECSERLQAEEKSRRIEKKANDPLIGTIALAPVDNDTKHGSERECTLKPPSENGTPMQSEVYSSTLEGEQNGHGQGGGGGTREMHKASDEHGNQPDHGDGDRDTRAGHHDQGGESAKEELLAATEAVWRISEMAREVLEAELERRGEALNSAKRAAREAREASSGQLQELNGLKEDLKGQQEETEKWKREADRALAKEKEAKRNLESARVSSGETLRRAERECKGVRAGAEALEDKITCLRSRLACVQGRLQDEQEVTAKKTAELRQTEAVLQGAVNRRQSQNFHGHRRGSAVKEQPIRWTHPDPSSADRRKAVTRRTSPSHENHRHHPTRMSASGTSGVKDKSAVWDGNDSDSTNLANSRRVGNDDDDDVGPNLSETEEGSFVSFLDDDVYAISREVEPHARSRERSGHVAGLPNNEEGAGSRKECRDVSVDRMGKGATGRQTGGRVNAFDGGRQRVRTDARGTRIHGGKGVRSDAFLDHTSVSGRRKRSSASDSPAISPTVLGKSRGFLAGRNATRAGVGRRASSAVRTGALTRTAANTGKVRRVSAPVYADTFAHFARQTDMERVLRRMSESHPPPPHRHDEETVDSAQLARPSLEVTTPTDRLDLRGTSGRRHGPVHEEDGAREGQENGIEVYKKLEEKQEDERGKMRERHVDDGRRRNGTNDGFDSGGGMVTADHDQRGRGNWREALRAAIRVKGLGARKESEHFSLRSNSGTKAADGPIGGNGVAEVSAAAKTEGFWNGDRRQEGKKTSNIGGGRKGTDGLASATESRGDTNGLVGGAEATSRMYSHSTVDEGSWDNAEMGRENNDNCPQGGNTVGVRDGEKGGLAPSSSRRVISGDHDHTRTRRSRYNDGKVSGGQNSATIDAPGASSTRVLHERSPEHSGGSLSIKERASKLNDSLSRRTEPVAAERSAMVGDGVDQDDSDRKHALRAAVATHESRVSRSSNRRLDPSSDHRDDQSFDVGGVENNRDDSMAYFDAKIDTCGDDNDDGNIAESATPELRRLGRIDTVDTAPPRKSQNVETNSRRIGQSGSAEKQTMGAHSNGRDDEITGERAAIRDTLGCLPRKRDAVRVPADDENDSRGDEDGGSSTIDVKQMDGDTTDTERNIMMPEFWHSITKEGLSLEELEIALADLTDQEAEVFLRENGILDERQDFVTKNVGSP